MNHIVHVHGLQDETVLYSHTWEEHLVKNLRVFLERLATGKMTTNLIKSEFAQVYVTCLVIYF